MNNNSHKRKKMLRNNKAEKVELEKLTAQQNNGYLKKFAPTNLIRLVVCLMVFIAGVATGLVSSSQRSTISLENYTKIYTAVRGGDTTIENINCLSLDKIVHPKKLSHDLSDQELVWRASLVPKVVGYPFKRVPKVAFMFLTRGPLPLLPLWEKYFAGHDGFFSIYVHTQAGFVFDVPSGSVFFGRQVPSKLTKMANVKELMANIQKLDKFEGVDFRRWQRKMHFFLTTVGVAYVLATPKPEEKEEETMDEVRKRNKWENDNYICCGHILNGMSDELFDIYQFIDSAKSPWDYLEAKYMAEDASSKKFLVCKFNNYKIIDSRPVMEQFHEIQRILGSLRQHNIVLDETFVVSSIIDKLPFSWKDFKSGLKHKKDDVNLESLASHIRIEEEIRVQEGNKDGNPSSTTVNVVEDAKQNVRKRGNDSNKNKGKKPKLSGDGSKSRACWVCGKPGHFKKDCTIWKKRMSKKKAQDGNGNASQSQDKQG